VTHPGPARLGRLAATVGALLALMAASCTGVPGNPPAPPTTTPGPAAFRVLVFSRTAVFRHPAIPVGVETIRQLGARNGFAVDATEDAGRFTDEGLAPYAVVVWLSTTGDVLDDAQQAAFERWVRAGGGFAGVHAAADTEYDWPFYGDLVGAWFSSHGLPQFATLAVEDGAHPSTAHLAPMWFRFDEWYTFRTDPRPAAHVLLSRQTLGGRQPLAWCSSFAGGRSWYTALGHGAAAFAEPAFRRHLLGGIQSVAGPGPATCGEPPG
jgi:cytochrome c